MNKNMIKTSILVVVIPFFTSAGLWAQQRGPQAKHRIYHSLHRQDINGDNRINRREFRGSDRLFNRLDRNNDRVISRIDLRRAHRRSVVRRLNRADVNEDKRITPDEFTGSERRFGRLDRNGDGVIDSNDRRHRRAGN